ncbi:hypothetical protein C0993_007273 [Termitomyces sp. T159_Od127]|nr:hypothetical protein C0993_007273 [Termitomyces sp. T159_Od127]
MQLKNLFVLASLAIAAYAQTSFAQIEDDINNKIAPALAALLNSIDAFPTSGGNLTSALLIHTNALNLETVLGETVGDDHDAACPIGDADAQAILADLQGLLPNIQQSLTDIVARKAAFQALPLGCGPLLVEKALIDLSQGTDILLSSFITCAPADIIPDAQQLRSEIDAAFAPAIAAFD